MIKDINKAKQGKELQLVIFKIAEEEFGVSISQVREIVRLVPITVIPRAPEFIEGVVNLRGQIIAVIDLAKRLSLKPTPNSEKTRIVVIEMGDNIVGMIVDEVVEVLRMPVESVTETPELISDETKQKYITGVGKYDKRLIILIDLASIFSAEEVEDIRKTQIIPEK